MDFGQMDEEEIAALAEEAKDQLDGESPIRGDVAELIRATRSREQWERYDSLVIARDARLRDDGWFNNFADFANASNLEWFKGRSSSIGRSYTNQSRERNDFAQDFYQFGIEFIAPIGLSDYEESDLEANFFPLYFTTVLPQKMVFRIQLAQSDTILELPGSHAPSGSGPTGLVLDQNAGPTVFAGTNGEANIRNSWIWPEPILIPAKASVSVFATVDNPARTFLTNFPNSPTAKQIPTEPPSDETIPLINEYIIRVTHRGPRYLQLRGARSS